MAKTGPRDRTSTGRKIISRLKKGRKVVDIAKDIGVTPAAVRYYKRMLANGSAK